MSNIQNSNQEKYGNDELYESWADNNIFFKLSNYLVDPLHNFGLSPNMITIISTCFTLLSVYFLHIEERVLAVFSYIIGYLLDCVDGRMARKYSLSSNLGMVLDTVSDNLSTFVLFIYILLSRTIDLNKGIILLILFIMTYLLSVSYGLNEAIASKKATNSDNFYLRRKTQLNKNNVSDLEKKLHDIFLMINMASYKSYKNFFPTYDEEKINNWLNILKHFGPGNYCLFISIILLII